MSEATPAPAPEPAPAATAGSLIRRAREARGLHIAALAASLKVPQSKLEALERDDYEQLPGAAFTRALAQSICRSLKIDAAPVLALLPPTGAGKLENLSGSLNAPYRERAEGGLGDWDGLGRSPVLWVVVLLVLGALAIAFWPRGADVPAPGAELVTAPPTLSAPQPEPDRAASAPAAAAPLAAPVVAPAASVPAAAASAPLDPAPADALVLHATQPSWMQVSDAGGRTLLSRTLEAGESVGVDGSFPLRLTIGNAAGTEVRLRGKPVDLAPHTRDNVARLNLQ